MWPAHHASILNQLQWLHLMLLEKQENQIFASVMTNVQRLIVRMKYRSQPREHVIRGAVTMTYNKTAQSNDASSRQSSLA